MDRLVLALRIRHSKHYSLLADALAWLRSRRCSCYSSADATCNCGIGLSMRDDSGPVRPVTVHRPHFPINCAWASYEFLNSTCVSRTKSMRIARVVAMLTVLGLAFSTGALPQPGDQRAGATGAPPAVAGADQAQSQAAVLWDSIVAGGSAVPAPAPGGGGKRGRRTG